MENYEHIYIVGDIHGDYHPLVQFIDSRPSNSLFIQVGDLGIGFPRSKSLSYFNWVDKALKEKQSKLYVIRGNHDDKRFFDEAQHTQNLFLLPDYTEKEINGFKWRFIGGATSIDRDRRREGVNYWSSEVLDYQSVDSECDVLIMHTAPKSCFPVDNDDGLMKVIGCFVEPDPDLRSSIFKDLKAERELAEMIFKESNPKFLYYGHFHTSHKEYKDGCYRRLLRINEIEKFRDAIVYSNDAVVN